MGRKSRRSAAGLRNALQQKRDVQVDDIASEEEANDSELREVPMLEIPDGELTGDDVVIADENGDELTKELKTMWDAFLLQRLLSCLQLRVHLGEEFMGKMQGQQNSCTPLTKNQLQRGHRPCLLFSIQFLRTIVMFGVTVVLISSPFGVLVLCKNLLTTLNRNSGKLQTIHTNCERWWSLTF